MTIRDLDPEEGMLLLRYRLLSPDQQKEFLKQMGDLSSKGSETPTDTPTDLPTD